MCVPVAIVLSDAVVVLLYDCADAFHSGLWFWQWPFLVAAQVSWERRSGVARDGKRKKKRFRDAPGC